ncbi:dCTP deaminase/dUTPase family protein [Halostella litorea]|uniref:dCTP deaminase n=1 Tax=Halostella litorea TaxID=2528831 RepID=UPI0010925F55|nr:dCTP deaminase [Halostella litorea]
MTDDIASHVDGLLHEQTQVRDRGVDLTAAEVYEVTAPGRVDFGGSELTDAERTPHDRVRRNEGDDYEWWHLDAGQYLVEYNESVAGDAVLTVQPRCELRERGASHPTLTVAELGPVPLSVGGAGIRLKENARISTVVDAERR